MRFWDSSALVPLFVNQAATPAVNSLYRADRSIVVWWGTEVECASAVARLERQDSLPPAAARKAFARLDAASRRWFVVQPTDALREMARRLLRVHDLRSADALQLAAAVAAAEQRPPSLEVACLDGRLARAFEREGFPLALHD